MDLYILYCAICELYQLLTWENIVKSVNRLVITKFIVYIYDQGPLLLTWFNFNPSMDK